MKNSFLENHFGQIAAGLAFLSAWGFFQFAYPYHLIRREQLDLFLYDWNYLVETYRGIGWLSHLAGDFVDQFFCFPAVGPLIVAFILTGIGTVSYRIGRHWLGRWPSLGIACVVFSWSFLRETNNLYITQYSISVLGYLVLILTALRFRKIWMKTIAAVVFVAVGILTLGSPCHKHYGSLTGFPSLLTERLIALDVNTSNGNWDKVLKLSEKDIYVNIASYFFNLASAQKGMMGNDFFNHSQGPLAGSLFLWVDDDASQFSNGAAGEVWFNLGDMTQAEQSTVVALQISPKHTGARFMKRLAEITLISGEYDAALKYLNILRKTFAYRKWALGRIPENMSEEARIWLDNARANLPKEDFVFDTSLAFRDLLKGLLRANPTNMLARQYLLMYDLELVRIEDFMEDYREMMIPGAIYEQAVLVWLNQHEMADETNMQKYGISRRTMQKFEQFFRYPERYENTYWYYIMDVTTE